MPTLFCSCETPVMDVGHDAGCRRCGLPVNFSPELTDEQAADALDDAIRQQHGYHPAEG